MAAITVAPQGSTTAPLPNWAFAVLFGAVFLLWMVTFEAGPLSEALGQAGSFLHELFHDGRHLIGVPCH